MKIEIDLNIIKQNIKKYIKSVFSDNVSKIFLITLIFGTIFSNKNHFKWFTMILTTFTLISNNFIQTMGVFAVSNKNKSTLHKTVFFGSVFVITTLFAWFFYNGQIHFELLDKIEYKNDLSIIVLFIPLLLFLFTKNKIPVSATFLIIPFFASKATISTMITKTSISYFLSFILSFFIWELIYKKYKKIIDSKENNENIYWNIGQYCSSGILWCSWLVSSISNFVIFLPRKFNSYDLFLFITVTLIIIYLVLLNGGGDIQKIVEEKKDIDNIKSTTILNCLYAFILFEFQYFSKIPMATTWVFLGLLSGRELAITHYNANILSGNSYNKCLQTIFKDLYSGIIGVLISLIFVKLVLIIGLI